MEQTELRSRARAALRAGAERAGARAHYRAMGIDPARLDGPIVGVVSSWTGTMPCNLNHRERRATAVQHDRRLGQSIAGNAGDARIPHLA
jgi:dihydroxy-acid dehydratase